MHSSRTERTERERTCISGVGRCRRSYRDGKDMHRTEKRKGHAQQPDGKDREGKDMHFGGRSTSLELPQGWKLARSRVSSARLRASTPSGQVQPFLGHCRRGSCGLSSRLHQIWLRSRCVSMLRQVARPATVRCGPRVTIVSSNRTTPQVDQVPHTEPVADFLQLRAARCKETAQQPIPAELLDPVLPALGAPIQPLKDSGQLRRDRGFPIAEDPTEVERPVPSTNWARAIAVLGDPLEPTPMPAPSTLYKIDRKIGRGEKIINHENDQIHERIQSRTQIFSNVTGRVCESLFFVHFVIFVVRNRSSPLACPVPAWTWMRGGICRGDIRIPAFSSSAPVVEATLSSRLP
jgi:hypothetical protein